jgi:hypothetical protein
MNKLSSKLGAVAGFIATPFLAFSLLDLFLGHCFYEQGCGRHEGFKLIGVLLAACAIGFGIGWTVARLFQLIAERLR